MGLWRFHNLDINFKTVDEFVSRSKIIDVLSKFKIEFDDWIERNDQILVSVIIINAFIQMLLDDA